MDSGDAFTVSLIILLVLVALIGVGIGAALIWLFMR